MTTTTTIPPSHHHHSHQHGVKGVYYGGTWLELEDCAGTFINVEDRCSGCHRDDHNRSQGSHHPCPRSQSSNLPVADESSSSTTTTTTTIPIYDVVIIGAGCIGAAIARELAKYRLGNNHNNNNNNHNNNHAVLWLEAADDVSQGATKGNSGIVHAGYDDTPGTNRAKYCWKGNQLFPQLDRELRFGYQLNGSLVLAKNTIQDRKELEELLERGHINGVQRLRIVEREELLTMEPHISEDIVAALYSPDAGNVIPYEYTIALAENAVDNGVQLKIRRQVVNIQRQDDFLELTVNHWEPKPYVDSIKDSEEEDNNDTSNVSFVVTLLGGIVAGIAYFTFQQQKQLSMAANLGIGLILALLLFLHQMFFGAKGGKGGPAPTPKTTPLKELVDKAGKVVGTGGHQVSVEDMKRGGSGSPPSVDGVSVGCETVRAKYVINCAGSASDQIAHMIGDSSFKIKPRLGDYLLLNRNQGHLAKHTLFPCPDPVLGKGVLVQTTLWGNLILGPTARDVHTPEHSNMSAKDIQHYILSKCQELVPTFNAAETIHAFCGARAKSDRGDWIIENSNVDGRMIHVAGIDSPGLAGSPAIALEVIRLLEESGCRLTKNPSFNPQRAPIITPKPAGMRGLKLGPVGKNDSDGINEEQMAQNVICKCEKVTELEVVRALRRSLPIDSTQAIRKRTRAGMGHCQGDPDNYNCEARVKAIIARETGMPIEHVGGRPWPATSTLSQRWPDSKELSALEELKQI